MVGDRLREMRTTRGVSLRELATSTGLSPTLISQVERGVTEPSLLTLRKLAAFFGESIAALFADPAAPSVSISRPGNRSLLSAPHHQLGYERLTPGDGKLEVLRGVLQPGQVSAAEPWSHPSTECTYVIAGELTAEVSGIAYQVRAGESISFDSRLPHRYCNESAVPTEIILAVTPPTP